MDQNLVIGSVGVLLRNGRYIYALVTKDRFFHKPTYKDLRLSLESLKIHTRLNTLFFFIRNDL